MSNAARRDLREVTLVGMSMAGGELTRYLTRHGSARVARVVCVATAATPFRLQAEDNPDGIPPAMLEAFVTRQLLRDYPQWIEDDRAPFFLPETPRPIQEWVRGLMLPDARLEACDGAPHGLFATRQARLTEDLLAFARLAGTAA